MFARVSQPPPDYSKMLKEAAELGAQAKCAELQPTATACDCGSATTAESTTTRTKRYGSSQADVDTGLILPFERTPVRDYLPGKPTDAYTYFHHYLNRLGKDSPASPKDFTSLPMLHIWPRFFEAYSNHWQRFRGRDSVVFLEIGVQSGGKIPLLREYFGPGFVYVGIDVNPTCKMFESEDWIHIEIGDSGDRAFLQSVLAKHPKIDVFLDDGGHTMHQQRLAMELVLPHLQADGVYVCEDLSTSWSPMFGGVPYGDESVQSFRDTTMMGLVLKSISWLNSGWMPGKPMEFAAPDRAEFDGRWVDTPWWKEFARTVKSIHVYNQLVVYEKGLVETPYHTFSVGTFIPYQDSGVRPKVQWDSVLARVKQLIQSPW